MYSWSLLLTALAAYVAITAVALLLGRCYQRGLSNLTTE